MRHIFWYQVQFSILAFLEKNAAIQYSQKRMQSQPEPWSSPFSLQPKIFCYVGLFYQQKREGERERERVEFSHHSYHSVIKGPFVVIFLKAQMKLVNCIVDSDIQLKWMVS